MSADLTGRFSISGDSDGAASADSVPAFLSVNAIGVNLITGIIALAGP